MQIALNPKQGWNDTRSSPIPHFKSGEEIPIMHLPYFLSKYLPYQSSLISLFQFTTTQALLSGTIITVYSGL